MIGRTGDVAEELCKLNIVQEKLAYLMWNCRHHQNVIGVTVPFGLLSDRYGRKTVLTFNTSATILYFGWIMAVGYFYETIRVEWIVVTGFTYIVGGGDSVAFASLFAAVADNVPSEIERTIIFAYLNAANYITMLLSSSVAAGTMSINLWLPMWIGIFSLIVSSFSIYLLPKTNTSSRNTIIVDPDSEIATLLAQENTSSSRGEIEHGMERSLTDIQESHRTKFSREVRYQTRVVIISFQYLLKSPRNFKLCLVVFSVTTLAKEGMEILFLYVSKRYHVTIAKAAFVFSVKAAVSIPLYTVFVPFASKYMTLRNGRETENLVCARLCIGFLCAGSIAISLANTIPWLIAAMIMYTMGSALFLFMLALIKAAFTPILLNRADDLNRSSLVAGDSQQNAHLYSIIGLMKAFGSVIGKSMITLSWVCGMKIGGMGLGLPFCVSAGAYGAVSVALWKINNENAVQAG